MRLALDKAARTGMGFVAMRNSNHLGAASYYAHMAVERDMIGLCMTGYLFDQPPAIGVLPLGGMDPIMGTNPIAMALPGAEEPPFVLDMATSTAPYNRIELFGETSQSIPPGWGLDERHQPTTDPQMVKHLLPLGGTREQGGHKGFGLAMMVHFLTGVLSGAWCENPDPKRVLGDKATQQKERTGYAQEGCAHFFGALRIDQFGAPAEFKRAVDETVRTLHASTPEPGQEQVYMAGEIEHKTAGERQRTGIPLSDKVAADLRILSATCGVPLELASGPQSPI
jgi:LDH2 family malate/lactate/ureidoglycolate dehydrogenase